MHRLRSTIRAAFGRPKLLLLGDHSSFHCGCSAVWQAINQIAAAKGWRVAKRGGSYDALAVNGEGSMHHSSRAFHEKMGWLREAVDAGKPAYLVNTVWQENTSEYDDVLRRLSGVIVREKLSQRDLLERHGIRARVAIDVSYFASADAPPIKDFHGSDVVTDFYLSDRSDWGLPPPYATLPEISMSGDWPSFVASLRTAGMLITGRHHAMFGACRAETPFAALESNTHKISGTIATSGIDIPVARHIDELPDVITKIRDLDVQFRDLFKWMRAQNPMFSLPAPGETWR